MQLILFLFADRLFISDLPQNASHSRCKWLGVLVCSISTPFANAVGLFSQVLWLKLILQIKYNLFSRWGNLIIMQICLGT